jgi:hypothetical protein
MNRRKTIGVPPPSKPLLPKRIKPIKKVKANKLLLKKLNSLNLKIVSKSKNNYIIRIK